MVDTLSPWHRQNDSANGYIFRAGYSAFARRNAPNQSASQTDGNNFVLHVGGALLFPVAIAITKSLGHTCLRSMATCLAVFEPTKLQMMSALFERLGESLNSLSPGEKR